MNTEIDKIIAKFKAENWNDAPVTLGFAGSVLSILR